MMVQPEELDASRKRYLWKMVHRLDILHSEVNSLYRSRSRDQRHIDLIWSAIDELEMTLLVEGVDYERYCAERERTV